MKSNPIQEFFTQLRISFLGDNLMSKYDNEKPPIRAELFSLEQLEAYARNLAQTHSVTSERMPEQLLKQLADNEEILLEVHDLITESAKDNERITPAGEWLLDNFYLIEEHVYAGKKHLPKGYSKGLPQLSKGPSAGFPRVYDMALELIAHSDGRVDLHSLSQFVNAYQEVSPLGLGELWAIPIMLRLALIENLRRLAAHIAKDRINKNLADYWADQMTETAEKDPKSLILVIADMARYGPPMESSFVAELTRRLVGKGPAFALPLSWIEQRLSEQGLTSDELVHVENQKQAADQVSIANSIGSLRFVSTNNWRDFVEQISVVEKVLHSDPAGVYPAMDFRTRDEYRHTVERVAKSAGKSELEIARTAVALAARHDPLSREAHVGYYLAGRGLRELERAEHARFPFYDHVERFCRKAPLTLYAGAILVFSFALGGTMVVQAWSDGHRNPWMLIAFGLLGALASSHLALTLINWIVTLLVRPAILPRMDFSEGIPDECRTLVAVPSMFGNRAEFDELLESMEVRYLANRDGNLYFALLTDFKDASAETLPGEDDLLRYAQDRVRGLNRRYGRERDDLFFLFHRPRKWNPREKKWMGFERKRGKLGELNELLRGRGEAHFTGIVGEPSLFPTIKYVITLDADTQLPRDAARQITGAMAHPLNRPRYSEKKHRVTEGYGILQPRVAVSHPSGESSLYARMYGNDQGIDPYTRTVSDVYQDLFGEGSFIGKGIYDVDAFEQSLAGRFPDNRILSHDLLEGSYARAGLLSDVQLYESWPTRYDVDVKRRHRWIRGDWQIATWLLPWVPGARGKLSRNPVSRLSKWKIFDNLRRSLVAPAVLALFLYAWLASPNPGFWTAVTCSIFIIPSIVNFFWEIWRKPDDIPVVSHALFVVRFSVWHLLQQLLVLATLPYEAAMNLDAILRTLWRIYISRRHLLQWNPSGSQQQARSPTLARTYVSMWVAPALAFAVFAWMGYSFLVANAVFALPLLVAWALVPAVVWRISLPLGRRSAEITASEKAFLYKIARKTWAYFETFVTPGDNHLPPDNYQESPVERIAHRTSPTNIGMALLANLTAYDFGYIPAGVLLDRCGATFHTMQSMERYLGHFYNWYDTQTLAPLNPRYISSVDSGNLAGHLLTLKQGLLGLSADRIVCPRVFDGLLDVVELIRDYLPGASAYDALGGEMHEYHRSQDRTPAGYRDAFRFLAQRIRETELAADGHPDIAHWQSALAQQVAQINADLVAQLTWLLLPDPPPRFENIRAAIAKVPTLAEAADMEKQLLPAIDEWLEGETTDDEKLWLRQFRREVVESGRRAKERLLTIGEQVVRCNDFADIQFDFLFDRSQRLLSIGYNVQDHRRDASFYDLLASESRLTTFVGIAQGKLTQDAWFALGRQLTDPGTSPVLLSWSGSMFEYLMPQLVMPAFENTLLDQTNRAAVQKQIEYGRKRGVYWGISESGYNMVDASLNYQYKAFGVPGLGLKRGLGDDLVIAPYATVMALMVQPEASVENLRDMSEAGFEGRYGFYEAVDYTPARLTRGQTHAVVRSFMVHHEGMSFLSLAYLLLDRPMQRRFESEAQFRAVMLLLQERVPHVTDFYSPSVHVADSGAASAEVQMRVIKTVNTPVPEVQILSNGRYNVMVTNSGSGYSRWRDIAVTRWREDATLDDTGAFCFVRDLENEKLWSPSLQPALGVPEDYEVVFSQGRAEFRRNDQNIETHLEIVVSSEDDVEIRRVHLNNRTRRKRLIEVTSYAEVVLTSPAADAAHPAFSNLFVQTEIIPSRDAIVCTRRPRAAGETPPWMFHLMKVHNARVENISFETDRSVFTGRTNSIHDPAALRGREPLSGSQGAVLDPIVAIRYRFVLDPHESATVDMAYGMSDTREGCNALVDKYQDRPLADRAFELAWTHSQVVLRQINASEADAQLYARLAGSVIFANPALRGDAATILRNQRGQSGLWSHAISGDLPIVLLQIHDSANVDLARKLVQAHAYWRLKGLMVDLVIWNEDYGGYRQALQNELTGLVSPGILSDVRDKPGGVFIRSGEQVSAEDRILFQTVARVVLNDTLGTLEEQLGRRAVVRPAIPYFTPSKFHASQVAAMETPKNLVFFNGTGGFRPDGREYIIVLNPGQVTPAPWSNVLANPRFGCVVTESGQSYSWLDNAHEYRLTPWNNDPVSDLAGEAWYVRDDESGKFWSPTPLPQRGKGVFVTRHGFGYSVFETLEDGIRTELTMHVDIDDPVKFFTLRLHNQSGRARRLSVTGYVEWVLGDLRAKTLMHVVTEASTETGALLAHNAYNTEFGGYTSFFDTDDPVRTFTCDRTEFLGRNGSVRNPEALGKSKLSGRSGAALDPCTALQTAFELHEDEEKEIVFRLGAASESFHALAAAKKYKGVLAAKQSLQRVKDFWAKTLGAVSVETPDPAVNLLANGWLNYQTLASRMWGRSGFYQSGGAFGFRDQLQDSLSLLHTVPSLVRDQILLSASRQFPEGDVQHWWHPPSGRGVRTTCSDDYLWLAYVTSRYVVHTGDQAILDEPVRFLEGRLLNPGEESYYDLPVVSQQSAPLYDHCVRAIRHGLRFGEHGLPLIGSGDWNDGFDKVGEHGKGESVWLAFFLFDILKKFERVARGRGDAAFGDVCVREAAKLRGNIEEGAWDGGWYRRAYFDDGTPLGSETNGECKIDSLPQSWSVISGAGETDRAKAGMDAAYGKLVNRNAGLIQLFDPPFDKFVMNPGYIQGYVPGVRENGGQYTHAAVWMIMGFAALGDRERTWELLRLVNPLNHGRSAEESAIYKVEPYVIAADVYSLKGKEGRGGWTWYTGSAGWMYQLLVESFFGLRREGNRLHIAPCLPSSWKEMSVQYRYEQTVYRLAFAQEEEPSSLRIAVDGVAIEEPVVYLVNDQQAHEVNIRIGQPVRQLAEAGK